MELSINVDVNHPFSCINLLLAFINRQIPLPITFLNMRKYLSLKNRYIYLLKSAIQKLAGKLHHCKSQKKKRRRGRRGKRQTKQNPRNTNKTRKKSFKK